MSHDVRTPSRVTGGRAGKLSLGAGSFLRAQRTTLAPRDVVGTRRWVLAPRRPEPRLRWSVLRRSGRERCVRARPQCPPVRNRKALAATTTCAGAAIFGQIGAPTHRLVLPLGLFAALLPLAHRAPVACNGPGEAQLLIRRARVLDVRTGRVAPGRTVLVRDGVIACVAADRAARAAGVRARDSLDARGRLLTPAFVDAHFHSEMVLGDSVTPGGSYLTHLSAAPDSVRAYRRQLAAAFLPFGVTLVRDVGSATRDLSLLRAWMARTPDFPDLLPSGAQLVSPEPGRVPPPFQVTLADSAAAAAQVRAYYALGFRHVKLYWRLREPAFRGALAEAARLGMTATAHVDNGVVTHDRALTLGVRHFEHVHPIAASVLRPTELRAAAERAAALLGGPPGQALATPGAFFQLIPEQWRQLGPRDARVVSLVARLRGTHSTLTPTLHVFAQRVGLAPFATPPAGPFEDVRAFTPAQRARAADGYRIMAGYVALMDERGVRLATGSDTEEPGRAVLAEIALLRAAGIPMWRALRIATLYAAEAVGRGAEYGAVERGRRADLILFDADPLADGRAVYGRKIVIKDGVVWRGIDAAAASREHRAGRPRAAVLAPPNGESQ